MTVTTLVFSFLSVHLFHSVVDARRRVDVEYTHAMHGR